MPGLLRPQCLVILLVMEEDCRWSDSDPIFPPESDPEPDRDIAIHEVTAKNLDLERHIVTVTNDKNRTTQVVNT